MNVDPVRSRATSTGTEKLTPGEAYSIKSVPMGTNSQYLTENPWMPISQIPARLIRPSDVRISTPSLAAVELEKNEPR